MKIGGDKYLVIVAFGTGVFAKLKSASEVKIAELNNYIVLRPKYCAGPQTNIIIVLRPI